MKIVYPELGGSNEWIQSSNPARDSKIEGYQPIKLDFVVNGNEGIWGGLGRGTTGDNCLIDDTPDNSYWWMCIGCQNWHGGPNTIPGPRKNEPNVNKYLVTKVELYVRYPN